jgi:hypothetical protein
LEERGGVMRKKTGSSPFLARIVCVFLVFERRERVVFSKKSNNFRGQLNTRKKNAVKEPKKGEGMEEEIRR